LAIAFGHWLLVIASSHWLLIITFAYWLFFWPLTTSNSLCLLVIALNIGY
jgi:hypothetical protein